MTASPAHKLLTQHPNIVLVSSGKGGVGKTWFSITFSQALASLGKKVLTLDGDLGLANIDIQLGLMPENDLGSFISGDVPLDQCITRFDEGGFDIIAGRSGTGQLAAMTPPQLYELSRSVYDMADQYDTFLIDLGSGIGPMEKHVSSMASHCLLIVTEDPTSMTDAYAFLKVMRSAVPGFKASVVINKATSELAGERTFKTLQNVSKNFLSYEPELMGIIAQDSKVNDAIRSQSPILTRHPNGDAATAVIDIAKRFVKRD
ncbi:MAG: AAA family ATPase [Alphaproteobacteria bacterium]